MAEHGADGHAGECARRHATTGGAALIIAWLIVCFLFASEAKGMRRVSSRSAWAALRHP